MHFCSSMTYRCCSISETIPRGELPNPEGLLSFLLQPGAVCAVNKYVQTEQFEEGGKKKQGLNSQADI